MFVTGIKGTAVTVKRGQDGTTIQTHLTGAEVKSIGTLVEVGDDFGLDNDTG